MKIFFDTEFTELSKDAELISIGLISEDGKEFYAERNDIQLKKIDDWVKSNVINNTVCYGDKYVLDIVEDENNYYVGNKDDIRNYLLEWLMQFDYVELVSDVSHYDMVLFIDIFGSAWEIPDNICPCCYDINQDIANSYLITEKEAFDYSREDILMKNNISIQGEKHNSLYDARVIKQIYEILHK